MRGLVLLALLHGAPSPELAGSSTLAPARATLRATAQPAAPAPKLGLVFGRILEQGTRRPLEGAAVTVGETTVYTDRRGRYRVDGLLPGFYAVQAEAAGHEGLASEVEVTGEAPVRFNAFLRALRFDPFEVVVRARRAAPVTTYTVDIEEVTTAAGNYGDALKMLQNLPGVQRTAFGLGGLPIRGSPGRDTKVFLDGLEIPQLFHFGGLTSVVNADTLERMTLTPGGFGARYGRTTGAVVELEPRGGKAAPHGYLDLDLLEVTFLAEAEVAGGGLLVSGRRSWLDTIFGLFFQALGDDLKIAPRAADYQARYDRRIFGGHGALTFFGADDAFEMVVGEAQNRDRPTFVFRQGFHRLQATWKRGFDDGWQVRVLGAAGLSSDDTLVGDAFASELAKKTGLLRLELVKRWSGFELEGGFDAELTAFDFRGVGPQPMGPHTVVVRPDPVPNVAAGLGFDDGGDTRENMESRAAMTFLAPAAWLEARWRPAAALQIVPGLRVDHFGMLGSSAASPRLAALVGLGEDVKLGASGGLYHGPPPLPFLAPVFGSPELLPERALHGAVSVDVRLPESLQLRVEVYGKALSDLAVPVESPAPGAPALESSGTGRSVGVEILLRRSFGASLSGWIAYTLSRSTRTPFAGREEALFDWDQTHVLTALASWRTERDWIFSARVRYASGRPYAPVLGSVYFADRGAYAPIFAAEPTDRLPGFFQLDLRVDKEWVFQEVMLNAYVDVQNATNHGNAEGWRYSFDYRERQRLPSLPILPTAGLKVQF